MSSILFTDAMLLDCTGRDPRAGVAVLVEGDRIARIAASGSLGPKGADRIVDCAGRTLMPGLIDAHVHLAVVDYAIGPPISDPAAVYALRVAREIEATLAAGFTTVRDAGGLDWGYKEAVQRGMICGPRLLVSNGFLSQTGGHGDFRQRDDVRESRYEPGLWSPSLIVDGPDRVRWAAREVLRRGADQVKVMANGGCMSPNDPLDATQLTVAELRAAVEEAEVAGSYVMAHTYVPKSMQNCIEAGVRTLEHGNFLDEATADRMAETGTYLVPTIATYELIAEHGQQFGVPENNLNKIKRALAGAYESLEIAQAAGVRIGAGSDLLGPAQPFKARELRLKAKVLGPMGALLASTRNNAEVLRMRDEIGTVEEGKCADLLLVNGNPLDDLSILEDTGRIHTVVLGGEVVVERD